MFSGLMPIVEDGVSSFKSLSKIEDKQPVSILKNGI